MEKCLTYRVDNKAHFYQCYHFLYFLVGMLCIPFLLWLEFGSEVLYVSCVVVSIWLLILLAPQVYLHFQYWKINRHSVLEISPSEARFYYFDGKSDVIFCLEDIVEMKTYISYAKHDGAPRWWPTDSYSHSVINLAGGSRIVVTSLLLAESDWPIPMPDDRVAKFFCAVQPDKRGR